MQSFEDDNGTSDFLVNMMRRLINDGGGGNSDQVVNSGEGTGYDLDNGALEDLGLNLGDAYYADEEDLDFDWDKGEPPFCAASRLHW